MGRYKFFLLVSVCLLFLQSSIVGGLVVGIVAAYKDTYVQNSGTLSDGKDHGHVIMTSPATIGLPLIVAPVLDAARLAAINDVSVTVADGSDGAEITYYLKVQKVSVINNTAAIFEAANDEAIFVWNGDTYFVNANGTAYPVCKEEATCAALYVNDEDEKDELEEKATAALEAGGFTEAVDRRRVFHGGSINSCGLSSPAFPLSLVEQGKRRGRGGGNRK